MLHTVWLPVASSGDVATSFIHWAGVEWKVHHVNRVVMHTVPSSTMGPATPHHKHVAPTLDETFGSSLQEMWTAQRGTVHLSAKGSDWQMRVWEALTHIPFGETLAYRDIADRLGNIRASRAVGQAVAHNPIALFVPCHRVIRSGGVHGGYVWGDAIKEKLLQAERAPAA